MPSKHWTLAFDTSAAHVAAALLCDGHIIGKAIEPIAKGQVESLFPLIDDLLKTHDLAYSDLNRIGVGIGPGNFTGIRISVSAARGLALALGIPAIGVSNFEATAHPHARPVTVEIAAPRDMAYVQRFSPDGTTSDPIMTPATGAHIPLAPIDALIETIAIIAENVVEIAPPTPLYIKPADAAPSRDAPVIHLS